MGWQGKSVGVAEISIRPNAKGQGANAKGQGADALLA